MDRLAELREQRALTLRELSKTSGVSPDTINQIELGHRKARPSTLRKLAKALDVDISDFFEPEEMDAHPKAPAPQPLELEERHGGDEERGSAYLEIFRTHMARRARAWDQQADEENSRLFADYRTSMAYAGEVYTEAFVLVRTALKEIWDAIDQDFAPEDAARERRDLLDAAKNMSKAVDKVKARDAAALERAIQEDIDPAELEEARAARERLAKERRAAFELLPGRWSA